MVLDEYYERFRTTPENAEAIAKQHQEMGHPPLRWGTATRPIRNGWCS